jgi:hypothetical protein
MTVHSNIRLLRNRDLAGTRRTPSQSSAKRHKTFQAEKVTFQASASIYL